MGTYRELKKAAKKRFKKHYWLYVAACLIAAFIGSEFALSLNAVKTDFSLPETEVFGRTGGVFAKIVNGITSGTLVGALKSGVLQLVGEQSIADNIIVIASMLAYIFLGMFIQNVYKVSMRRIFLEGRIYNKVGYQRFLYIIRAKKWIRTAWNMLVLSIFQLLWMFTIIGPAIVRYSYYMVPYIFAENPGISARRAMILSKKMMNGHKWKCFLFEMSFLGWQILGLVTGGIAALLFANPYKIAAFSEVYAQLREKAIEKHVVYSEYLKDEYLFNVCESYKLNEAYADIIRLEEYSLKDENYEIYGLKGKIVHFLGISLLDYEKEKEYEASETHKLRINLYKSIIAGNEYPDRLSIFPEKEKRQMGETLHYMRHYSIWSIVLLFFTFAAIGWTWEVLLHIVQYGSFVNRGMLHGPWLPIYGVGGVMILTVLSCFRKKPLQEFVWAIVLCGVVEYATSYVTELIHGIRWWDYHGFFLNINGRICAEGLLVFGVGGIVIVYVVAPLLDNQFRKIKHSVIVPLCIGLIIIFAADMVYSSNVPNTGKGITSQAESTVPTDIAMIDEGES